MIAIHQKADREQVAYNQEVDTTESAASDHRQFKAKEHQFDLSSTDGIFIQPKLKIGAPNDRYEQEADRMADLVVRNLHQPTLQTKTKKRKKTPLIQRKCQACQTAATAPDHIAQKLQQKKGQGTPLAPQLQAKMEQGFGVDFSKVRVHTDSDSIQMNQQLGARAFTHGSDVYFNRGEFQPSSMEGQRLLAHELTHVVQQREGLRRNMILRQTSNLDPECEDLLVKIIARIVELKSRADALKYNPLNLPQSGRMSIEGHQQQFKGKQVNLRRMLENWDNNNCNSGLPEDAWHWATRPVPRPIPGPLNTSNRNSIELKDGSDISVEEVATAAGSAVFTAGAGYIIYRVARMLPSLLPQLWWTIPANATTP